MEMSTPLAVFLNVGRSSGLKFNADHMPPLKVGKEVENSLLWRLLKRKVRFKLYPQCVDCSNQQGIMVREDQRFLRFHFLSFRPYHLVGAIPGLSRCLAASFPKAANMLGVLGCKIEKALAESCQRLHSSICSKIM